jgi:alkanesulfonate monooxygenase SsuD/methylene tetrahydromethanopterin reductase-like flavin-dependent oxidoreductase (luciferase family)
MSRRGAVEVGVMVALGTTESQIDSAVRRIVTQARRAEESSLDLLGVGHHIDHSGRPWLQPVPTLTHLAAITDRIKLMTAILLVPLYHPVTLAEDLATLHVLSDGRFVLGAGMGWRQDEYVEAGLDWAGRRKRMDQTLRAIRGIWAGQGCTMEGADFTVDVGGPGLQLPGGMPDIVLAGQAPAAVARAARQGDGWIVSSETPLPEFAALAAHYRSTARAANRGDGGRIVVMRNIVIKRDSTEAGSIARRLYYSRRRLWQQRGSELFLAGDLNECAAQAQAYIDAGADAFLLTIEPGGHAYAELEETMELLGQLRALLNQG